MMRGEDQPNNATADRGARSAVWAGIAGLGASMQRATRMFSDAFLWAFRGVVAGNRFSSLTRRIVVFQVVALLVLVAGVLYLNQFRQGLIDARKQALLVQAEIIAGAVAETAAGTLEAEVIDPLADLEKRDQWVNPDLEFQDRDVPISATAAAPVVSQVPFPHDKCRRDSVHDGRRCEPCFKSRAHGRLTDRRARAVALPAER